MLSAAPPRASPSSLVRMEPVMLQRLVKMRGDIHRFLAGGGVEHEQNFLGLTRSRSRTSSCTSGSSICSRPAVSKMSTLRLLARANSSASRAIFSTSVSPLRHEHGQLELLCRAFRAGPWPPDDKRPPRPATARGPACASSRASLPEEVVLPEPCKPTIRMAGRDCRSRLQRRRWPEPSKFDQFVVDDFDDLLAGLDALNDFLAQGLGFDALDEIAGHLEIHVGFQQRHAHFAQGFPDVFLGDFSEAAQVPERILEFAAQSIEHRPKVEGGRGRSKCKILARLVKIPTSR